MLYFKCQRKDSNLHSAVVSQIVHYLKPPKSPTDVLRHPPCLPGLSAFSPLWHKFRFICTLCIADSFVYALKEKVLYIFFHLTFISPFVCAFTCSHTFYIFSIQTVFIKIFKSGIPPYPYSFIYTLFYFTT